MSISIKCHIPQDVAHAFTAPPGREAFFCYTRNFAYIKHTMQVHIKTIHGTSAAAGWAGPRSVVIDRTPRAGGLGIGFSGEELFMMAIGASLCNDLLPEAATRGIEIAHVEIIVNGDWSGEPHRRRTSGTTSGWNLRAAQGCGRPDQAYGPGGGNTLLTQNRHTGKTERDRRGETGRLNRR